MPSTKADREKSGENVSPHAYAARLAKRKQAFDAGIDETYVAQMVDSFYTSVREDEMLGPIFDRHVTDWPHHLDRMKSFWRSILFSSGEYAGNPMVKHLAIAGLEQEHFDQWLKLFYATLKSLDNPDTATPLVAKSARSIADSLLTAIAVQRQGVQGGNVGKDLPYV